MNHRFKARIHGAQVGENCRYVPHNLAKIVVITLVIRWGPIKQWHSLIPPNDVSNGSPMRIRKLICGESFLLSDYPLSAKPREFQEALILESTVALFNIPHNAHHLARNTPVF